MLTEIEIFDCHQQALGEAREACQMLGRNADPEYINLRGNWYAKLKKALDMLEGSARQIGNLRSDARWLRFGIHYARIRIGAQAKYGAHQWAWFTQLIKVLEVDLRTLQELSQRRTGVNSSQPILPQNASHWLQMPEYRAPDPRRRLMMN